MRLTLVISALTAGGAERVLSTLANHWAESGFRVTMVTADDGSRPPFYPLHPAIEQHHLGVLSKSRNPFDSLRNNVRYILRLRQALRRSEPDAIISFITECNVRTLCAAQGMNVPVLVSERNDPTRYASRGVWSRLRQLSYRKARFVIVQTEEVREFFASRINAPLVVIPNPVTPPKGPAADPAAHKTILSIGRLVEQKGYDLLLRAFAGVAPHYPEWKLRILGEGPLRGRLETLGAELELGDQLELPGIVQDTTAEYRSAGMFVSSSRWEGFPNALCEAMSFGLPVIATDSSAGTRQLVDHERNGLLVPAGESELLAQALQCLCADDPLRARFGAAGTEVCERFSVDSVAARWERLLVRETKEAAAPLPAGAEETPA